MNKCFVFGKFLPFHKGHQAMIEFALGKCDFLSVLICASEKENITGELRKKWITETFAGNTNVEVLVFNYREEDLVNSSVASREVSIAWANEFKRFFPSHNLVITSEVYGDYVAEAMGIQHILFDQARQVVPCSGSMIRNNVAKNWDYLPDSVKRHYVKKVVILGTESTGKSTLAKKLADRFNATLVTEAGRDLIDDSTEFSIEDLYKVATAHALQIESAVRGKNQLVIMDTDVHITQSYARFTFEKTLELDPFIYETNKAHLYLYLCNDVPHVQDGTRLDENQRNKLDDFHRLTLTEYGVNFIEVKGSWENRESTAIALIHELLCE